MPEMTIEIKGLDQLIRRFGQRSHVLKPIVKALDKSVKVVQARLAKYPRRPTNIRVPFVSQRQRVWFFAALRSGEIQVPYRRTGTLGRSITTQVDSKALEGRVGTKLSYAPYVLGDATQARWMGHWHTFREVAKEKLPDIQGHFVAAAQEITVNLAGR